ncbi:MAG: Uma2 family endonuclease [Candidatus Lokiarchaeota archaeon]|nr:Uma2 family endonuclease [Candidatus Harpocratesius repetitus]
MEEESANDANKFRSTRHALDEHLKYSSKDVDDDAQMLKPRLGRRESEPHSANISYIYDVLSTNFPEHRVIWDLHHYFYVADEKIDIQFDISFFLNLKIDYQLSSYKAEKFNNRVPDLIINILSKSTWHNDLLENVALCERLRIKYYIVFFSYEVSTKFYPPPFLRVYYLNENSRYQYKDLTKIMFDKGKLLDSTAKIQLSPDLPFDVALECITKKYDNKKPIYKIIFLKPNTEDQFLTEKEIEKQRADKEKKRADEEKRRADEEKRRADEEKRRADEEKRRADEEKRRADEEKKRAEKAEELVKKLKEKLEIQNQ